MFTIYFYMLYRSVIFNNLFSLFIFTTHVKQLFLKYKKSNLKQIKRIKIDCKLMGCKLSQK